MKQAPEFIYEWIEHCKKHKKSLSYAIHDMFLRNFLLERFGDDDDRVRWLSNPENQEVFAREWLKYGRPQTVERGGVDE